MTDNLFLKLDIPLLSLEDVGKIVSNNSLRLLKVAKEVNDYVGKNNIQIPNYNGFFVKFVPNLTNNPMSSLKVTKNGLVNRVVKVSEPSVTMSPQIVQCVGDGKTESNDSSNCRKIIVSEVPEHKETEILEDICGKGFENQEKNCSTPEESPEISALLERTFPPVAKSNETTETPPPTIEVKSEVDSSATEKGCVGSENVEKENSMCVISNVVGNVKEAFMESESSVEQTVSFIKPKKTNDITKIKGWRKKQFYIDKVQTKEFHSCNNQPSHSSESLSKLSPKNESAKQSCRNIEKRTVNYNIYDQPSSSAEIEPFFTSTNECERETLPNTLQKPEDFNFYCQPSSSIEVESDINKAKGWRRKQCLIEKPTTVEFFSYNTKHSRGEGKRKKAGAVEHGNKNKQSSKVGAEPQAPEELDQGNKENAFICDSLDDFLDNESELKVNYEIPHLYAEVGIKLTSDDIVSRPNLSEEDFRKVETKYCIPVETTELLDSELEEIERGLNLQSEEETEVVKTIKSEDGRRRKIRTKRQINAISMPKKPKKVVVTQGTIDLLNSINLVRKFIGLTVYPKPGKPLHPIVRQHLNKLRSYHTKIDKNWAHFAASVVCPSTNRCQRFILPVYICGKMEDEPVAQNAEPEIEIISENIPSSRTIQPALPPPSPPKITISEQEQEHQSKKIKLTECKVVLEKLKMPPHCAFWCMEHNCYNCEKCGLLKLFDRNQDILKQNQCVQGTFEKHVAALLAKKLKHLKPHGDVLIGVDSLKTLKPDSLELIKLNFIKQSFLSGLINIWYLKPNSTDVKSRAFLTFSQQPPMPNAINVKLNSIPCKNLPQVITEIMSANNHFDSNEYAILHCNGKIWEIHGSLSLAIGKNETGFEKNVEQIYSSAPLPQLCFLQSLSKTILDVRSSKWWVLDLTQKFNELKIKSGPYTAVVIPKKLFKMECKTSKFLSLRKYNSGRVLGAYIYENLLPYILIGPYHLFEKHELFLNNNSSSLPFMYFGEENSSQNCPLKFFINSVILEYEHSEKRLCGLWLYDKIKLDNTCYLEVTAVNAVTCCLETLVPKKYSIEVEHGYSLNSGSISSSQGSNNSCVVLGKKECKESLKKTTVYIYFEVFDLGYIVGELQQDYSVIITHPLDQKNKVKSENIGDWFIQMIKKKINFFPSDLTLAWFITKHKEDLRDRLPFNKFYLGGAHILCKKGLFFMLELTEEKILELGLDKESVYKAVESSKIIAEVKELKNLAHVLTQNSNCSDNLSMEQILLMASEEINQVRKISEVVEGAKKKVLSDQLKLVSLLLLSLKSAVMNVIQKVECLLKVKTALIDRNGSIFPYFVPLLEEYDFGKKFIILTKTDSHTSEKKKKNKKSGSKSKKRMRTPKFQNVDSTKPLANPLISKLEIRLQRVYEALEAGSANPGSTEHTKLLKKIESISSQLNSIKYIFKSSVEKSKANTDCKCHENPNILKTKGVKTFNRFS